ncbi:MAG: MBL fold metallo-hydrolase [Desulfatiglans sp.]|jgi:glyoxylase-like metal-dependent hydrolase (beta-lactamase superfamily II)|nr:MBL fold metallo-hydrolase [Desulfatiglans sp.]
MKKITDHVFAKTSFHGCNSGFIVTKEGAVVIDTPMVPSEAREWKQKIEEHAPVKYVIINEAHTDHYCGGCYLGGTVIGTDDSVNALKNAKIETLIRELSWMAPGTPAPDETFYFRPPEIAINGDVTLYLHDHTIKILMVPGHTAKQLAVYVPEEKVLFTSDNINLAIPIFIDALPHEWITSLNRLSELDVEHVIPGHGEITDKSAFKNMKDKINIWMDFVGGAINQGMDLEKIRSKIMVAKEFERIPKEGPMAGIFNMNLDALYRALSK